MLTVHNEGAVFTVVVKTSKTIIESTTYHVRAESSTTAMDVARAQARADHPGDFLLDAVVVADPEPVVGR